MEMGSIYSLMEVNNIKGLKSTNFYFIARFLCLNATISKVVGKILTKKNKALGNCDDMEAFVDNDSESLFPSYNVKIKNH